MKKVYLIHGWDGSPNEPMHRWIAGKCRESGIEFIAPEMPNAEEPKIEEWIGKMKEIVDDLDDESIFIGHSVGCQAVLRYLELIDKKVLKIILIAPWMRLDEKTIEEEGEEVKEIARPWMETPIDFERVKKNCGEIICIFSDNDPYVPLSEENFFKEKLNAKTIVLHNRGYFDPSSAVKDLPEILEFLK